MRNIFWGFGLVLLGVLLLLDNLGVADFGEMLHDYWPLILILWGLSLLARRRAAAPPLPSQPGPMPGTTGTADPSAAGSAYAGTSAGAPYTGPQYAGSQSSGSAGAPFVMEGDLIHQSEVFGDAMITVRSQNFLGGSVSSVFGDSFVDLSGVTIAEGDHTLRIHTVFGNSRIMLPKNAAIAVTASGTFGSSHVLGQYKSGFSSFMAVNTPEFATSPNRLKIVISRVFGDLYVQ